MKYAVLLIASSLFAISVALAQDHSHDQPIHDDMKTRLSSRLQHRNDAKEQRHPCRTDSAMLEDDLRCRPTD